jgi:hypothetical protein
MPVQVVGCQDARADSTEQVFLFQTLQGALRDTQFQVPGERIDAQARVASRGNRHQAQYIEIGGVTMLIEYFVLNAPHLVCKPLA